jgi:predicted membrane protein
MTTAIKRSLLKHFLNTASIVSPTWSQITDGVTSAKINLNPKVTTEQYIGDDVPHVSLDSYAPTMPIPMTCKFGDAVFTYLNALFLARSTLADAESEVLNVQSYKGAALGYYYAEKQSVAIQSDDFGGDAGTNVQANFTLNYIGAPVSGAFNPTTGVFVAAPVNTILTTMVIGSVTLIPLFATDKSWLYYAGSVSTGTTTVTMSSTLSGATIVQKDTDGVTVDQGDPASLDVGVNHLTVEVSVGAEEVIYHIDITRAAS